MTQSLNVIPRLDRGIQPTLFELRLAGQTEASLELGCPPKSWRRRTGFFRVTLDPRYQVAG